MQGVGYNEEPKRAGKGGVRMRDDVFVTRRCALTRRLKHGKHFEKVRLAIGLTKLGMSRIAISRASVLFLN